MLLPLRRRLELCRKINSYRISAVEACIEWTRINGQVETEIRYNPVLSYPICGNTKKDYSVRTLSGMWKRGLKLQIHKARNLHDRLRDMLQDKRRFSNLYCI